MHRTDEIHSCECISDADGACRALNYGWGVGARSVTLVLKIKQRVIKWRQSLHGLDYDLYFGDRLVKTKTGPQV